MTSYPDDADQYYAEGIVYTKTTTKSEVLRFKKAIGSRSKDKTQHMNSRTDKHLTPQNSQVSSFLTFNLRNLSCPLWRRTSMLVTPKVFQRKERSMLQEKT